MPSDPAVSVRLTFTQKMKLWLGITYRCRCGALVSTDYREQHEEFHRILQAFMRPPSRDEMEALRG